MRNLINLFTLSPTSITESVGLANRKAGETFVNDKGDLLNFVGIKFFPESGKFDDAKDMQSLITDIESRKQTKIEWVNKSNAGSLGFGIAEFTDSNNAVRLVGRYFSSISNIFTANYWPNSALPDGFKYNKSSAQKMSSGLMPQDVLSILEDVTPEDVLQQIESNLKFGKSHPLTELTRAIVNGNPLPLSVNINKLPEKISFSAFRDFFSEILHPIAVIRGVTTGNASEAETVFFGKHGFKGASISYGSSKNTGLSDSIITSKSGKIIKISSKGGAGAAASVKNLNDAVAEMKVSGNQDLLSEYTDVIDIIGIVNRAGQSQSPLKLAEKFGLISGKETSLVNALKSNGDLSILTTNLMTLYNEKVNRNRTNISATIPYYTLLSAIAELVADHINENTNFSNAAADILNHSALVQVYTDASENGDRYILNSFRAVYPSSSVAGVKFYAGKTYYNTGIKGNFTFKLFKAGQTPEQDSTDTVASITADTKAAVNNVVKSHINIRPPGTKRSTTNTATRKKR